jgi:hypothetical protein
MRGTSNKNITGSSEDRRRRKRWLLVTFGDGESAECSFEGCTVRVTFETITVDRFPIPGYAGGTYKRDNIRPACAKCNYTDGSRAGHRRKAEKKAGGST